MFWGRRRPSAFVFPACEACNRGSKDLDQINGYLSRLYPDPAHVEYREENSRLIRGLFNNYPEVLLALRPTPEARGPDVPGGVKISVDHPFIHRSVELFGAKLGFAFHWRLTQRIVPPEGGAAVWWYTNAQAVWGEIPPALYELFPEMLTLEQGTFNVREQFKYNSAVHPFEPRISFHLAVFRLSYILLSVVAEDRQLLNRYSEDHHAPGCFQGGYPYGLPLMSPWERQYRLEALNRALDELSF
jgi:hypothetical protein